MTKEEAKEVFLNRGFIEVEGGTVFDGNKWRQACVVISKWLEQELCDDAINREELLLWLDEINDSGMAIKHTAFLLAVQRYIRNMPSVNPVVKDNNITTKVLEDIKTIINTNNRGMCDYFIVDEIEEYIDKHIDQYNFCPNCNTRMVEPQENEDKE